MPNPLLSVRQKIQAVIPEIKYVICNCDEHVSTKEHGYHTCGAFLGGRERHEREITLADVLLAIEYSRTPNEFKLSVDSKGYMTKYNYKWEPLNQVDWDFKKDLSQQDSTVFEFLDEILK